MGRSCYIFGRSCYIFDEKNNGIGSNDVKRVIAYSTCSQLGYMVVALSLSHYALLQCIIR
jgi:NADH-ubiquinone oxidoreductase chain 5